MLARRGWPTYDQEIVRHSKNCDFIGNTFGQMDDTDSTEECIEICRQTSDCTHFMYDYVENTCYLKKEKAVEMTKTFAKKKSCGYFPDRRSKISQPTTLSTLTSVSKSAVQPLVKSRSVS